MPRRDHATLVALPPDIDLRTDGGWVDEAAADLQSLGVGERHRWWECMAHASRAFAHLPLDSRVRHRDEGLMALRGIDLQTGNQTPSLVGTERGDEVLQAIAPPGEWFEKGQQLLASNELGDWQTVLSRWFQAATRGKLGLLNRRGGNRYVLEGLVWLAVAEADPGLIDRLRQLAVVATRERLTLGPTIGVAFALFRSVQMIASLCLLQYATGRPLRVPGTARGPAARHAS